MKKRRFGFVTLGVGVKQISSFLQILKLSHDYFIYLKSCKWSKMLGIIIKKH